jgi:hypothetical protein
VGIDLVQEGCNHGHPRESAGEALQTGRHFEPGRQGVEVVQRQRGVVELLVGGLS